jgi:hypothetical protein
MKVLEKKVYYCDFCKKHMLTKGGMKVHESKCLRNPGRVCAAPYCAGTVGTDPELVQWVIDKSETNYDGSESSHLTFTDKDLVQELRSKLDGCPICTVAVFMQAKLKLNKDGDSFYWDYDLRPDAAEMYSEWASEQFGGY